MRAWGIASAADAAGPPNRSAMRGRVRSWRRGRVRSCSGLRFLGSSNARVAPRVASVHLAYERSTGLHRMHDPARRDGQCGSGDRARGQIGWDLVEFVHPMDQS
jgi:hypothetical protein